MSQSKSFVYILRCSDNSLYTGSAKVLETRVNLHQSGKGAKYTRGRLPVELVYQEAVESWGMALKREAEIKRLTKKQKLTLIGEL